MKRLFLMTLVFGVGLCLTGCSDTDPVAPESGQAELSATDEAASSLAKFGFSRFEGKSETIARHDPGTSYPLPGGGELVKGMIVETRDDMNDKRVNGNVVWVVNAKFDAEGFGTLWGTGELVISGLGSWEMQYMGWLSADGLIYEVVGQGKGGLQGQYAHWRYDMTAPSKFDVRGSILQR